MTCPGGAAARLAVMSLATTLALAPAGARAQDPGCFGGLAMPTVNETDEAAAATLCLVNRVRAAHGRPPLQANSQLALAARRHSHAMVDRRFFGHEDPGGKEPADRALSARYVGRGETWSVGETLAWGVARFATPAGIVDAWMRSPAHRAVLLSPRWRRIGVGVATGLPHRRHARMRGATYTALFGSVDRAGASLRRLAVGSRRPTREAGWPTRSTSSSGSASLRASRCAPGATSRPSRCETPA